MVSTPGSLQDGATALLGFLEKENVLSELRLAATGCSVESVIRALGRCPLGGLTHLDLSHVKFSHRRSKGEPKLVVSPLLHGGSVAVSTSGRSNHYVCCILGSYAQFISLIDFYSIYPKHSAC